MALALLNGSSESKAFCRSINKPVVSPVFLATIPITSIPKSDIIPTVCFVGLIRDARPDFKALAPSDALTPPSLIAVK